MYRFQFQPGGHMATAKEEIEALLGRLPDDWSVEDV
jgi:hypothetical protein